MTQKLLPLFILLVIILNACNEYEEDVSQITYANTTFHLSDILREDYGPHSGEHYNIDYSMVGEAVFFLERRNNLGQLYYELSESAADCFLFIEFFSPGTESFIDGKFLALGDRNLSDVPGQYVFRRCNFRSSGNSPIFAEEGTIRLSISNTGVHRLYFDLKMYDGRSLKGAFTGKTNYHDKR
ncbi:MAG: hypothetical protein ACI83W_000405 [Marinoscillum sp.]|jgi:hypothetical protein